MWFFSHPVRRKLFLVQRKLLAVPKSSLVLLPFAEEQNPAAPLGFSYGPMMSSLHHFFPPRFGTWDSPDLRDYRSQLFSKKSFGPDVISQRTRYEICDFFWSMDWFLREIFNRKTPYLMGKSMVSCKISLTPIQSFCVDADKYFPVLRGSHLSPFRMTNFSNSGRCDGALTHNLQPRSVKWWAPIPVINGLFIPVQVDNMTPLSICRYWSSFTSIVTWSSPSQVGMTTKRGVLRTHLMKYLVFWGSLESLDNEGKGILHAIRWKL